MSRKKIISHKLTIFSFSLDSPLDSSFLVRLQKKVQKIFRIFLTVNWATGIILLSLGVLEAFKISTREFPFKAE